MENHGQFGTTQGSPGLTCSEFDLLLSDALDGVLSDLSRQKFELHRNQCSTCASLFRETAQGLKWLDALEEVEPPASLVHNILAATSMQAAGVAIAPQVSWKRRLAEVLHDLAVPLRGLVREPRLVLTAAMAIFSLTLSLNLAGIRLADLRHLDLRPSAIRETATLKYTQTTNRMIHYYYSIRLVYQVESRLQELKRATTQDEDQQRAPDRNKTEKQDQERRQNYYSMERDNMLLAKWGTSKLKYNHIPFFGAGVECAGISCGSDENQFAGSLRPLHNSMRGLLA